MKKNILLLSILLFTFFSSFSQYHLDFEGQFFGAQNWTENGTDWAITTGWANLRNYNGTAYSGAFSIDAPDNDDVVLENSESFNLNSLWIMWDYTISDATSFTFTGYDGSNNQVGSPVVVNTATLSDGQYHNIVLNFNGITKLSFHPDGSFISMGTAYIDYLDYSLNSTLPIGLSGFTAQLKNNAVNLNWTVSQQTNSKTFTVQHSINSFAWENLSVLKANEAGNMNYSYLHINPANGVNYYRIIESIAGGTTSYSDVKTINFNSKNSVCIIKGNPVTNGLLTVEISEPASLSLYTTNGVLIWNTQMTTGTHTINVSNYSKGDYLLKANTIAQKVIFK